MRPIRTALIATALAAAAFSPTTFAQALIQNWELKPAVTADNTHISQLLFVGESFIHNTFGGGPTTFTFTDAGVFNIFGINGGTPLHLGGGQLTAVYSGGTGSGSLATGNFSFNATGTLNFYYNTAQTYSTTICPGAGCNNYGASDGMLIGTFKQLATPPGQTAGTIDPNGTPSANGHITSLFQATFLAAGVWLDSATVDLAGSIPFLLGFTTVNASEDTTANGVCPSATCTIDPNLVGALGGTLPNDPPNSFLVSNGGQFKLERVPEPGTIALLGLGLLGLGFVATRRRQ
jgi:hypothetical protein